MANLKQKLKILEEIETKNFNYEKIPEFITQSNIDGLFKPILTSIIKNLIILDTQISAVYDLVSEEEWYGYFALLPTPCSTDDDEILGKTKFLTSNFLKLYETLNKTDITSENIIDILQEIFNNKTRNIQFLLFMIAKTRPKHIFGYLMAKLRKYPKVYAPFFCSLLVRLRLNDDDFKLRCAKIYFNHVSSMTISKSNDFVLLVQFLFYIMCFKKDYYYEISGIKEFTNDVFESELYMIMNKDIVKMFCKIFGYQTKSFENIQMECMSYFPFDAPICPEIYEIIKDDFIEFS